ncbi:MAG: lysophospholipid acyltransferase family protein [bacterium]|nr:lysophospholipid acyltransferase family protein [bacterium]
MAFFIALRLGLLLALVLPYRLYVNLAGGCMSALSRLSPKRRVVAGNLAAMARASGRAPVNPARVFASYGRYWGELLSIVRRPSTLDDIPLRVEGEEHLRRAAESGPVCVLTAHVGNWDLMGFWLSRRLPEFTVVVEELKPERLFRLFKWMRERGGDRILVAEGQGMRLFRHLKRGGSVALAADRVVGNSGENGQGQRVARIAGGYRSLPGAGMDLAQRAGATLLPMFMLREGEGFVLKVHPALSKSGDPVQAFADVLECTILEYPEQWVVLYALHDAASGLHESDELVKGAAGL